MMDDGYITINDNDYHDTLDSKERTNGWIVRTWGWPWMNMSSESHFLFDRDIGTEARLSIFFFFPLGFMYISNPLYLCPF